MSRGSASLKIELERTPSKRWRWQLVSFIGERIEGGMEVVKEKAQQAASEAYHRIKPRFRTENEYRRDHQIRYPRPFNGLHR